jgi:hypothetical protein
MALYQLLRIGVLKTDTGQRIVPASGELWQTYTAWLAAGNVPDPYVPPVPPAETLAEAKVRRTAEILADGLARVQQRVPAVRTFELLQLLREIVLSIAPSARAPTADMAWLGDMWTAGANAAAAVNAATTIAQVNAVTPAWPLP